jgi:hypothetical protein
MIKIRSNKISQMIKIMKLKIIFNTQKLDSK